MSDLREKVIRLAHEKPELRKDLLPLLTKEAKGKPMVFALRHGDDKEVGRQVTKILGRNFPGTQYAWDVRRGVGDVLQLYIAVTEPVARADFKKDWAGAFREMMAKDIIHGPSLKHNLQQALRSGNLV